jgi:hypothetical protein
MCVYISVYMHTHTYIHMYICMCTFTYGRTKDVCSVLRNLYCIEKKENFIHALSVCVCGNMRCKFTFCTK